VSPHCGLPIDEKRIDLVHDIIPEDSFMDLVYGFRKDKARGIFSYIRILYSASICNLLHLAIFLEQTRGGLF
jgi:hypothetical protein